MSQVQSENQNDSKIILTLENINQNWQILGKVNLNTILPENFPKIINYWSFLAFKIVNTIQFTEELTISNTIQLMRICKTSVLLTQKSFQRGENCTDPIAFLSGIKNPPSTPDPIEFSLLSEPEISESVYYFAEVCKHSFKTNFTFDQIINYSIYFSMIQLNFPEDSTLFNHFNEIYGCTTQIPNNEIQNILNFEDINSLLETLRRIRLKMNQPCYYILRYLFENAFNYKFKLSYNQDNFYQNLLSKGLPDNDTETILLTCFNYISGNPVQFEPSRFGKNQTFFCCLCLNNLVSKENKETFTSKFSNEFDPWIFIIYAFYINIFTPNFANDFLNFIHHKELNGRWKSAFASIAQSKNIKINLERENLYIQNIKSLFMLNDSKGETQTKDENTKLDENPPIPEKIDDDLTAPILFWYNFNQIQLKVEIVTDLLNKLNSYFQECLQKTVVEHPLFIHSESLEFHCSYFPVFIPPLLPTKPEDFLSGPPPLPPLNSFTIVNLILSQLIEISIKYKYDLPLESLVSFCCNYYIGVEIKDKIFSLYETQLNEKAAESNLYHLNSIFNEPDSNPDKYKCIQLISPILSILPFSFDFIILLLKSDDKYIPIINQVFENSSFQKGIDSLEQSKVQTMLDLAIKRNYQNITIHIIKSLSDINFIASLVTSIAFTNPSIALFLYKSISNKIKSSQIISLMSDHSISHFPSDSSVFPDFINFLITISDTLEYVPFTYQLVAKSKHIPTIWEEDFASKSTEVLTKAFINIWEFPPMTQNDINNETQKILSSKNSHHSHEDCQMNNNIFDHYCCTYKKGQARQPCFYCYTCGLVDRFVCCLGCAMTCHRGHDLVYVNNTECICDCYRIPRMCIFNPKQENLYSNEEIATPNIEMTLENLHNIIDEGGDISFHQRQFLSALFNNERIPDIQVTKPYLGTNNDFESHQNTTRNLPNNDEILLQLEGSNFSSSEMSKINSNLPKSTKSSSLNPKSLLNLFLKVASIHFEKKTQTDNDESQSFELGWQDIVRKDKTVTFTPIDCQPVVNWNEMQRSFAENDAITHIIQRCIISPLSIAAFVSDKILVVSNGKSLISYRSPYFNQKLSRIDIQGFITQISPNKTDQSLVAVSTLTQVYLLKIDENGNFTIQNDKIIKFQQTNRQTDDNDDNNTNSNSVVLNIFWIDSKEIKIAILLQNKMVFYDLKNNANQDPYMTLITKESEKFRSAAIVDHKDKDYVILTLDSGKYMIHPCQNEPGEKAIISPMMNIFSWLPEKPIIGYSSSKSLIFITSSGGEITIIKKDDFFSEKPLQPFKINTPGTPSNLVFIGNHPKNQNMFIFFHGMSGGIATVEITKSLITFSLNDSRFDSYRFPILTKDTSPLSIFKGPSFNADSEELYSISMNGKLNRFELLSSSLLKRRKPSSSSSRPPIPPPPPPPPPPTFQTFHYFQRQRNENDDDNDNRDDNDAPSRYQDLLFRSMRSMMESTGRNDDSEIDPLDMKPPIKVPPAFWAKSRISTDDNIEIVIPNVDRNPRSILQNEKVIFNHNIRKKCIEVTCQSDFEVIIGFRFFVSNNSTSSHRPPYLALNGRITKVDEPRWYFLPLAADEIETRKPYRVEMGNRGGLDINCDGFGVFVIEKSLIEESISIQNKKSESKPGFKQAKVSDWFSESSSLLSFNDDSSSYGIRTKKKEGKSGSEEEENDEDSDLDSNDQKIKKSLNQLSYAFSPPNNNNNNKEKDKDKSGNENDKDKDKSENENDKDKDKSENENDKDKSENDGENKNDDNDAVVVDDASSFDEQSIRSLVELLYTNKIASIPARRVLLRIILSSGENQDTNGSNANDSPVVNQKIIGIWSDVIQTLLKEKKVLPDLWEVLLRDFSLMPKEEQDKISDLLWDNHPPAGNEFAFFSAFVS